MVLKIKTKRVDYGASDAFHLPRELRRDSAFPFPELDDLELIMEIRGETLVIRRPEKGE